MVKTILILEDNEKSFEMLKKIILNIDSSFKILYSKKLEQAYSFAFNYEIDLFLVDIVLNTKEEW